MTETRTFTPAELVERISTVLRHGWTGARHLELPASDEAGYEEALAAQSAIPLLPRDATLTEIKQRVEELRDAYNDGYDEDQAWMRSSLHWTYSKTDEYPYGVLVYATGSGRMEFAVVCDRTDGLGEVRIKVFAGPCDCPDCAHCTDADWTTRSRLVADLWYWADGSVSVGDYRPSLTRGANRLNRLAELAWMDRDVFGGAIRSGLEDDEPDAIALGDDLDAYQAEVVDDMTRQLSAMQSAIQNVEES